LKFQAVAEKNAKDARGLLYFAAPGIYTLSMLKMSSKSVHIYDLRTKS